MKLHKIILFMLIMVLVSCKSKTEEKTTTMASIEVQGHRGDRGNYPENSIPAFLSAVKKGVDVIELDVVISKDRKVVVSHEPFMSSSYMLKPDGSPIAKEGEKSFNLFEMTYDSIKKFDGGSKYYDQFPHQKKIQTYKPLLSEVIDTVENYIVDQDLPPIKYNIELKSNPLEYSVYQPHPNKFVEYVMQIVDEKGIHERAIVQSFDPEILNVLHEKHPQVTTAYLVFEPGIKKNLSLLNFRPKIYSPHFGLVVSKKFVDSVQGLDMELIPWTVNIQENIEEMIKLGVDGIISDYPERVLIELGQRSK